MEPFLWLKDSDDGHWVATKSQPETWAYCCVVMMIRDMDTAVNKAKASKFIKEEEQERPRRLL